MFFKLIHSAEVKVGHQNRKYLNKFPWNLLYFTILKNESKKKKKKRRKTQTMRMCLNIWLSFVSRLVVWTPHWQMNFTPYLFVKEFRPQCISTKIIHANTVQCVYLYSSYDWLFCTSQITLSWVFYRWHVTSFLNLYAVKFCTLKPRHKVKLLQESSEVHLLPYRLA